MSKKNSTPSVQRSSGAPKRDTSAVGLNPIKRDPMGFAMGTLAKLTGSDFAARFGLKEPIERVAYQGTKTGFQTLGAATRAFNQVAGGSKPARLEAPADPSSESAKKGFFDLTPTDEQQLIVETVAEFAEEQLRPAAYDADNSTVAPAALLERVSELGITLINIPEDLGGAASDRGAVTNVLVTEALAHGDAGLAVALLAPSGVAIALTQWGTDAQQKTYLPDFAGDSVPASSVIISEPHPLFDPFALRTKAVRFSGGYKLNGVKSFVPRPGESELFIVAAELEGRSAFFIIESDTAGLVVEADPSMGLRGAGLGRLVLNNVVVPAEALLGDAPVAERTENYANAVRLSRLAWAALASGVSSAVLDYVIPYVNEREAFGEPISHRQAVAFSVANIAIERDGLRLITLRGASRAEQGLSFAREAGLARKYAADHGMRIGLDGVQLLGGHGFTKEHPVERWYRDLRAVAIAEGTILI